MECKYYFLFLRYNNFQHDPLSQCDCSPPYSSENAIAARSDLNPANGTYPFPFLGHRCHGATDTKVILYINSVSRAASLDDLLADHQPQYDA